MEPETTIKRGNSGQSWKITKTASDGTAKHTIGKVIFDSGKIISLTTISVKLHPLSVAKLKTALSNSSQHTD